MGLSGSCRRKKLEVLTEHPNILGYMALVQMWLLPVGMGGCREWESGAGGLMLSRGGMGEEAFGKPPLCKQWRRQGARRKKKKDRLLPPVP